MGNRHRTAFRKQQARHWFANNVRPSNDNGIQSGKLAERILQHQYAAKWRAGHHCGQSHGLPPRIDHMKAIHILHGINGIQNRHFINLFGKRKLDQNAMDCRISVKPVNDIKDLNLSGRVLQSNFLGLHPGFLRCLALITDIDLACRILANQHDRKARRQPMLTFQDLHLFSRLFPHPGRKSLAVNHCRCHF